MKFTKMHGCQNDFVVINCFSENLAGLNLNDLAAGICDRRNGVGADGLILIKRSDKADAFMQIFNADGSEDTMCGNGIRCTAKYIYEHGIVSPDKTRALSIETLAGVKKIDLELRDSIVNKICVDMGVPELTSELPEAINIHGMQLKFIGVDTGTAHSVYFIEDNSEIHDINSWPDSDFAREGVYFERHSRFPEYTTSDFVEILSPDEINMRVYERGCGETMACGTGSTASVFAGFILGKLNNNVLVHLRGGDLSVRVDDEKRCFMTGPAVETFSGEFYYYAL
ncbi:MAG: diaminopimelate epimerase [Synergistaceae bacterium]|nr:diaminopimelate epimerase [Synergistaceae bacterium]